MEAAGAAISVSGYYHVIARGCGQQIIFEGDQDREKFLALMGDSLSRQSVALIAWCLMDNHIHMVVRSDVAPPRGPIGGRKALSAAMHGLLLRYAKWFNWKSGHAGHVFQNRFGRVPIESDAQLLEAVRYVHLNPERAGICPLGDYPWSSFGEYLGEEKLVQAGDVLALAGGRQAFAELSRGTSPCRYFPFDRARIADADVLEACRAVLGIDPRGIKAFPRDRRNRALGKLLAAGLTILQVQRATGIGRGIVQRVSAGGRRSAAGA